MMWPFKTKPKIKINRAKVNKVSSILSDAAWRSAKRTSTPPSKAKYRERSRFELCPMYLPTRVTTVIDTISMEMAYHVEAVASDDECWVH